MATSTWTAAGQSGNSPADAAEANDNWRNQIRAASISTSGNQIRIKVYAHSGYILYIDGTAIEEQDGEDYVDTPTRITWDSGSSTKEVAAGGNAWSDWINFDLDSSKSYLIHCYIRDVGGVRCIKWADQSNSVYYADGDDYTMTVDYTATGFTQLMAVGEIEVRTSSTFIPKVIVIT